MHFPEIDERRAGFRLCGSGKADPLHQTRRERNSPERHLPRVDDDRAKEKEAWTPESPILADRQTTITTITTTITIATDAAGGGIATIEATDTTAKDPVCLPSNAPFAF
jgi:hypothetical protein